MRILYTIRNKSKVLLVNHNSLLSSKTQKGFTLITLLILSTMASVIVLNSLKDNVVQERLSGNYQKQVKARLAAEKGIFDTYLTLSANLLKNPDATLDELSLGVPQSKSGSGPSELIYKVSAPTGTLDAIAVDSIGERKEGAKTLQAVFAKTGVQTPQAFPFSNAVLGCDGITTQGASNVNSYDSRDGDWNGIGTGEATVRTLKSDSTVKLIGNSVINGDVLSSNSIEFGGSAEITGNVQSNGYIKAPSQTIFGGNISSFEYVELTSGSVAGSIFANGYVDTDNVKISGNIFSGDYITAGTQPIEGNLLARGEITLKQAAVTGNIQTYAGLKIFQKSVAGSIRAKGDLYLDNNPTVTDDIRYAGTYSRNNTTNKYAVWPYKRWAAYFTANPLDDIHVVELLPGDYDVSADHESYQPCDSLGDIDPDTGKPEGILPEVAQVKAAYDAEDAIVGGSTLALNASSGTYTLTSREGTKGNLTFYPITTEFLNSTERVFMFKSIHLNGGSLEIAPDHHVTIYVDGNFTMIGNQTTELIIPTNSTLTMIVNGKVFIHSDTVLDTPSHTSNPVTAPGVNANGKPIFSIYSGYESAAPSDSDIGIDIGSKSRGFYAMIYAPYTDVKIYSEAVFKGGIIGKSVTVSGSGTMAYDAALSAVSSGTVEELNEQFKIVLKGWEYK